MPVEEYVDILKNSGKILGIDIGDKRYGFAISDTSKRIALPYKVIEYNDIEEIKNFIIEVIERENIIEIVAGMPYKLDGTESAQTLKVKEHIKFLKSFINIPIKEFDERLTTSMAHISGKAFNVNNKKRKKSIDKIAATIILQNYLDSLYF